MKERNIYKLQVLIDAGEGVFDDLWLDVNNIYGFMLPYYAPGEEGEYEKEYEMINIFHTAGSNTIKKEKHIEKFLLTNFVNKAI